MKRSTKSQAGSRCGTEAERSGRGTTGAVMRWGCESATSPASAREAHALLARLGAPPHLLRHVELVGEAADLLLACFCEHHVPIDETFVRVGVVLHDAGKIEHPRELTGSGDEHEPAGERLLLAAGVTPPLARVCLSHARWRDMVVTLEELAIALADKLWKGVRAPDLEQRVVQGAAAQSGRAFWDVFLPLDSCFERIAEEGHSRLERSRDGGAFGRREER